jgi:hypothetical protein
VSLVSAAAIHASATHATDFKALSQNAFQVNVFLHSLQNNFYAIPCGIYIIYQQTNPISMYKYVTKVTQ